MLDNFLYEGDKKIYKILSLILRKLMLNKFDRHINIAVQAIIEKIIETEQIVHTENN